MNVKHFIGASSILLLAWLGATYLHQVPSERYPKQTRSSMTAAADPISPDADVVAHAEVDLEQN